MNKFGETARELSNSPLRIIALFIVLVYGFASLVVGLGSGLDASSRTILVWFMVLFPILVLIVFAWLVGSDRYPNLYGPGDYERGGFVKMEAIRAVAKHQSPELLSQILLNLDPSTHDADETAPVEATDPTVTEVAVDEASDYPGQERADLFRAWASITSVQEEQES